MHFKLHTPLQVDRATIEAGNYNTFHSKGSILDLREVPICSAMFTYSTKLTQDASNSLLMRQIALGYTKAPKVDLRLILPSIEALEVEQTSKQVQAMQEFLV